MFEILAIIVLFLTVAAPWIVRWADTRTGSPLGVIVFIVSIFSTAGLFFFTARLVYFGIRTSIF